MKTKFNKIKLLDTISHNANINPFATAVICNKKSLNYSELEIKSSRLANYLLDFGMKPEFSVGVLAEHTCEVVIAILAILKAGGNYVPISSEYPTKRIKHILSESQAHIFIASKDFIEDFQKHGYINDIKFICFNHDWPDIKNYSANYYKKNIHPHQVIYTIYTSGSTGNPKGVQVCYSGIENLIGQLIKLYKINVESRVLQFTSLTFDVASADIFTVLSAGCKLYMPAQSTRLSGKYLWDFLYKEKITHASLPVSILRNMPLDHLPELKALTIGGEACDKNIVKNWGYKYKLFNAYGPTETTVTATTCKLNNHNKTINIGSTLKNVKTYALDRDMKPVQKNQVGELYISGNGLSRGYVNDTLQTAEKFLPNPFDGFGERIYRTGDLVKRLSDNQYEFIGRIDNQYKLRGYRVESEEIERAILSLEYIYHAAVIIKFSEKIRENQLYAYIVTQMKEPISVSTIKADLVNIVPSYMVPDFIYIIDEMPLTQNGKVDRKKLYQFKGNKNEFDFGEPLSNTEEFLINAWSAATNADKKLINTKTNLFDIGGNSLSVARFYDQISKYTKNSIQLSDVYNNPTINSLACFIEDGNKKNHLKQKNSNNKKTEKLAVIGMAVKVPGASNIEDFWSNLIIGEESLTNFTDDEILQSGVSPEFLENQYFVKSGFVLKDPEMFDAQFFGYKDDEAERLDPQLRMLLECSHEALERSGYSSNEYEDRIGIFVGTGANRFAAKLLDEKLYIDDDNQYLDFISKSSGDFSANQLSYRLGLTGGPVINLYTACSTSLVAVDLACQSLKDGSCDIAIAGGAAFFPDKGYLYKEGYIHSPDGRCRPFDILANGASFGSGCGIVVMKRYEDAINDGDNIHALIIGSAVNNDGSDKAGFAAPSNFWQEDVISSALKKADVSPEAIKYVEAHGTGTRVGDPIEVEALTKAYKRHTSKNQYCALGSIKSNIGHLDAAAGVTGFIKTVLCLKNKIIPPSINFTKQNESINFAETPFYINKELRAWQTERDILRAGVSSFGVGGTNAHIILEEFKKPENQLSGKSQNIFPVSAKKPSTLNEIKNNLIFYLKNNSNQNIANIAYTLQVGRKSFKCRQTFVAESVVELIEELKKENKKTDIDKIKPICFVLSDNIKNNIFINELIFYKSFKKIFFKCFLFIKKITNKNLLISNFQKEEILFSFSYQYALINFLYDLNILPKKIISQNWNFLISVCFEKIISIEEALTILVNYNNYIKTNENKKCSDQYLNFKDSIKEVIDSISIKKFVFELVHQDESISEKNLKSEEFWLENVFVKEKIPCHKMCKPTSDMTLILIQGDCSTAKNTYRERNTTLYKLCCNKKSVLTIIGRFWELGHEINWKKLEPNRPVERVELPTYPFDKKAFWPKSTTDNKLPYFPNYTSNVEYQPEIYQYLWHQDPLLPNFSIKDKNFLLFYEEGEKVSEKLINTLEKNNNKIYRVVKGDDFHVLGEKITVKLDSKKQCQELFEYLFTNQILPDYLVYGWLLNKSSSIHFNKESDFYEFSLPLLLIQVLENYKNIKLTKVFLLTVNAFDVIGDYSEINARQALSSGLAIVSAQENDEISIKHLDFKNLNIQSCYDFYADQIISEMLHSGSQSLISFSMGKRWIRQFEKVKNLNGKKIRSIKNQGVYLITGGLGGIGLYLAEHLSKNYSANIILISRKYLPAGSDWEENTCGNLTDEQRKIINKFSEIEKLGGRVYFYQNDISNKKETKKLVNFIKEKHGTINGVFHSAGVAGGKLIKFESEDSIEDTLRPKVQGSESLIEAFQSESLDFLIFFSSMISVTGELGQAAYCAANAFQNSYAEKLFSFKKPPVITIIWEGWRKLGMALNTENSGKMSNVINSEIEQFGLEPDFAVEALEKIINYGAMPVYIVSSINPKDRINLREVRIKDLLHSQNIPLETYDKSISKSKKESCSSKYTDIEQILLFLWKKNLGLSEDPDYDEDFLALGGDSLLLVGLMGSIKESLGIDLSLVEAYDDLTFNSILKLALEEVDKKNIVLSISKSNSEKSENDIDHIMI